MYSRNCIILLLIFLLFSIFQIAACYQDDDSNPLVRPTLFGKIRGFQWDDDTYAWLGVRYAMAPVDELRWKAPRDPMPWDGVRDTAEFCSECPQFGGILLALDPEIYGKVVGSEDCLHLNIWRPVTDDDKNEENLPVFLWIHGGMNSVGEGATSLYHGAAMAGRNNMVVVTINYRLGPLGWFVHKSLETGDPLDDSGNYGLLDIIHSLRWVRDNISFFGGDPGNVTVAGESAGGFNVVSLLASPLAKGLFHRAVSLSPAGSTSAASMSTGSLISHNIISKLLKDDNYINWRARAKNFIRQKGEQWTADYLRKKSFSEILGAATRYSSLGINEIGLLIENSMGSRFKDGTVIPIEYEENFIRGDYNRVPLIIGSNTEEVKIFEMALGIISKLDEREVCELVVNFDPGDPAPGLDDIVPPIMQPLYHTLGTKTGELMFTAGGVDSLTGIVSLHQDVFVYKFSWNDQPAPMDFLIGASHMMEIPFVFGNFQADRNSIFRFAWSSENYNGVRELGDAMMSYWGSFSRTGDPNTDPNAGDITLPVWKPWSNGSGKQKRLLLDTEIFMVDE